jgi:hypothetical protein
LISLFIIINFPLFTHDAEALKCDVPSSKVRIVVKQESDNPLYTFTVSNRYDTPIVNFYINSSSLFRLVEDDITPEEFISPDGWSGEVARNNSKEMFYSWHVSWDNKNYFEDMIQRGETRSGFKILLPKTTNQIMPLRFTVIFEADFTYCSVGEVIWE